MEVEDFASQLQLRLAEKNENSPTYRKAEGVLASLLHAAKTIPNFSQTYAIDNKAMALYITAGVLKLLKRTLEGEQKHEHNLDAYLLLLTLALPEASPDALIQGGINAHLRNAAMVVLGRRDNTPFVTRLATSMLSHAVSATISKTDFKRGQEKAMVLQLFEKAITSARSNVLSRECSKLLVHFLKINSSVSTVIAEEAKQLLLSNLQEKKQLYLANVKQVMAELPVRLLNDIVHRTASNMAEIDATDPNEENYLAQTYFFLQKMTSKLLPSTLEDLILMLVTAVPAGTQPQRVQLSFLQLLYEATVSLTQSNEAAANKILSPVVSVLIEELLISPKIAKFAGNLLINLLANCIRPSLWRRNNNDELSLDFVSLQQGGRNFSKLICHIQSLLSSRFTNTKLTASILTQFFNRIELEAAGQCAQLIQRIVDFREQLQERSFRRVFESILLGVGVQNVFSLFPLSLNGDIASPDFEDSNNLWLLNILQRTERSQSMGVFYSHIFPLIQACKQHSSDEKSSKQRKEGYALIEGLLWRCLKVFCRVADPNVNYQEVFALIDAQIKQSNDSTQQQLAIALECLAQVLAPLRYRSPAAEQLIKTLALTLDVSSGSATQVSTAIKGLSRLAPPEYIKRVFDKNIEKLISLAESKSLAKEEGKNLKNLEILMVVNSSIDLSDTTVTTNYRLSREQLLLKLVGELINSSGIFQKKGYKYLNETLQAAPNSLYLQVLELFEASLKVEVGARHHRLAVIGRLWAWVRRGELEQNLEKVIGFIKTHLPQILLSLRDQNGGARSEGVRLMGEFTDSMQEMGLIESFVQNVCAGLVGERSEMKLATLAGLGVIIARGYCTEDIFKEVLEIVLLLLREKRQELYKGVVQFCRRGVVALPIEQQLVYLPNVIQSLFEEDEEGKMEHRSVLRHFLIKLTKKHGREQIEQMVPQAHRKMLAHTLKMENREKRKKREQNIARRQQFLQNQKQQQEHSSQSESEGEQQVQHRGDAMQIQGEEQLQDLDNTNNLLLKYDLEKEQFHFQKEQRQRIEKQKKVQKNKDDITFDDKGIMIIEDRKRTRNNDDEEQEEEQTAVQQHKDVLNFKKKTKTQVHQVKESGQTYKSSRAGGDVRLKDKPQPYAFIQFSSKALNKRFKKRAEHVFENLFEKKEGGLKGLKSRIANGR